MPANRQRRALDIFELAMDEPEEARPAYLDRACGNDRALRSEVDALIASLAVADEFLEPQSRSTSETASDINGRTPGPTLDTASQLDRGSVLQDRYTIVETIGSGGMGHVYRAIDSRLDRDVAIKVLSHSSVDDSQLAERFEREVRSVAALSHPNIMTLHDVGTHADVHFAVMELIDGKTVRQLIKDHIDWKQAVEIAKGIAAGLEAAHSIDLMHRDIKPENIMVASGGITKVLDFGLARSTGNWTGMTLTGTSLTPGTIPYMSPEQAEGKTLRTATDIFSFGTVLVEMLIGTNPFRGSTAMETLRRVTAPSPPRVREHHADIPMSLETLLGEMLQRDPGRRPSAIEIARRLDEISVATEDQPTAAGLDKTSMLGTRAPGSTTDDFSPPDTVYAKAGPVHIAYQVFGDGPLNLVCVPGFVSNIDNSWASSQYSEWLQSLGEFARVAVFDKRGTGLSDRVPNQPDLDTRLQDIDAVMDAAGFESAALFGQSEGGSIAALFAALHPARTDALIVHGGYAHHSAAATSEEESERFVNYVGVAWGSGMSLPFFAPSIGSDPESVKWWGKFERLGASPGDVIDILNMARLIDIRQNLPSIESPTLIIHRDRDVLVDPHAGQDMADQISGARLMTPTSSDHLCWIGETVTEEIEAIEEFLLSSTKPNQTESRLATVVAVQLGLFKHTLDDDHKDRAAAVGPIKHSVLRFRGSDTVSVDSNIVSMFDNPIQAVQCAKSIADVAPKVRIGIHFGDVSGTKDQIRGPAIDAATGIAASISDGQIVTTRIVTELAAAAGFEFSELSDCQTGNRSLDTSYYSVR